MKLKILFTLALLTLLAPAVLGQVSEDAATTRKLQLIELESKETQLRLRLEELEEAIKPQNIEFALAGIGSTRPEELREHRRRMLSLEIDGVRAQLKALEGMRMRLESANAYASVSGFQEKPMPSPPAPNNSFALAGNTVSLRVLGLSALVMVLAAAILMGVARLLTSKHEAKA